MIELFETIQKGGLVMWPIIILGLITIAICIERALYFGITGIDYRAFRRYLVAEIASSDLNNITLFKEPHHAGSFIGRFVNWLRAVRWNRSVYVKIAAAYIDNLEKGERSRDEALKRIGSEEIEKMERNFKGLSAISHISPLLGLLGTVTGIIAAFSVISKLGGQVDVTALAGGIWEAMMTTAGGLIVAIPAQLAFLYFEKIVSSRANRMSYVIAYLNEELYSYFSDYSRYHGDRPDKHEPYGSDSKLPEDD